MTRMRERLSRATFVSALALVVLCTTTRIHAQTVERPKQDTFLLTIVLKHDQSKTVDEINEHLKKTGFNEHFPPKGVEIVSWYVMMGLGQVVTLRVPPDKLREVNLAIEKGAWGGFRTEFYPTYDFKPIWDAKKAGQP